MSDPLREHAAPLPVRVGAGEGAPTLRGAPEPVRAWTVSLDADEIAVAVHGQPGVETRFSKSEASHGPRVHEGSFFVEPTPDGMRLWRRPKDSLMHRMRGVVQPVPYPDMLRLTVERTREGTRVAAAWERHPATSDALMFNLAMGGMMVACVAFAFIITGGLWLLPLLVAGLAFEAARFRERHSAKAELLRLAHAALSPHERGRVALEASAFRADR